MAFTIGLRSAPACEVISANQLKLENPFNDNKYEGRQELSIAFRQRLLPGSNLMIKGILI